MGDLEPSDGRFDQDDLETDGIEPCLMTVEEGGGWYVSPTYTVLESIRRLRDLPAPDFGEPTSFGAATPAEAIEATIAAWGRGDARRIIEALPRRSTRPPTRTVTRSPSSPVMETVSMSTPR